MHTLLDNFSSVQWWVGVVIVGIVINLLSIFIKNKCDASFSKLSSWWRNKSEKRKKEFESAVNILRNNPQELIMASFLELKLMNYAIYALIMSLLLFLMAMSFIYIIVVKLIAAIVFLMATIILIQAGDFFNRSSEIANRIRAARK